MLEIRCIDLSSLQRIEDNGGIFRHRGLDMDILNILKYFGINCVRLKILNNPKHHYENQEKIIEMANRLEEHGLKLLLDFHYSDTWADPDKQFIPRNWSDFSYEKIKIAIHNYTRSVLEELPVCPDLIQTGNEITNGLLFPHGRICYYEQDVQRCVGVIDDSAEFPCEELIPNTPYCRQEIDGFSGLLKASGEAVRAVCPNSKIIIHIDKGGDRAFSEIYYQIIDDVGVDFDVIGLSFYPFWHGSLQSLSDNVNNLALVFNKPIMVVETSYPFTSEEGEYCHNRVGYQVLSECCLNLDASVESQANTIRAVFEIIDSIPRQLGLGVSYWEGGWLCVNNSDDVLGEKSYKNPWANQALFDLDGNAIERTLNVFSDYAIDRKCSDFKTAYGVFLVLFTICSMSKIFTQQYSNRTTSLSAILLVLFSIFGFAMLSSDDEACPNKYLLQSSSGLAVGIGVSLLAVGLFRNKKHGHVKLATNDSGPQVDNVSIKSKTVLC